MNLFKTNHQLLHVVNTNLLNFYSPLGELVFDCKYNDISILGTLPSKVMATDSQTLISYWANDHCIIEFLRLKFNLTLPAGMKVDDCVCGIWRIKALKEINCDFACFLKTDMEGSPEPGEALIAQSFENEEVKLTIGTEDEEHLECRAEAQDWLPTRFKLEINADQIKYISTGIKIDLPKLFQNEQAQVHYIVAWSSKKNPDISTWYAVDQSIEKILKQADIT